MTFDEYWNRKRHLSVMHIVDGSLAKSMINAPCIHLPHVEKVNVTISLDFLELWTKNGKCVQRKSNVIPFRLCIPLSCALRIFNRCYLLLLTDSSKTNNVCVNRMANSEWCTVHRHQQLPCILMLMLTHTF